MSLVKIALAHNSTRGLKINQPLKPPTAPKMPHKIPMSPGKNPAVPTQFNSWFNNNGLINLDKALPALEAPIPKSAAQAPAGYTGVSHQQFLPVGERRELTDSEQADVETGKSRWLPKIFKSYSTPAHQLMSSPGKGALLTGLAAGGLGAAYGGLAGHSLANGPGAAGGALLGGALAGIPAAALAYFTRRQQNENIEETMRRSRENPTYRDIQSDPLIQRSGAPGSQLNPLLAGFLAARAFD